MLYLRKRYPIEECKSAPATHTRESVFSTKNLNSFHSPSLHVAYEERESPLLPCHSAYDASQDYSGAGRKSRDLTVDHTSLGPTLHLSYSNDIRLHLTVHKRPTTSLNPGPMATQSFITALLTPAPPNFTLQIHRARYKLKSNLTPTADRGLDYALKRPGELTFRSGSFQKSTFTRPPRPVSGSSLTEASSHHNRSPFTVTAPAPFTKTSHLNASSIAPTRAPRVIRSPSTPKNSIPPILVHLRHSTPTHSPDSRISKDLPVPHIATSRARVSVISPAAGRTYHQFIPPASCPSAESLLRGTPPISYEFSNIATTSYPNPLSGSNSLFGTHPPQTGLPPGSSVPPRHTGFQKLRASNHSATEPPPYMSQRII
uniref:Uncharacterized protein n=1 Tax=Knipowitschia caucasica TaxID=637954 RepID=A0AAV2L6A8_KNICA